MNRRCPDLPKRCSLFGVLQEFKHGISKNRAGKEALILLTLMHMCIFSDVGSSLM